MVAQGEILSGRYLLEDQLGSGGMGTVYRAVDLRTGAEVAVKVPHPFLVRDKVYVERLRREAQIAASLNSPRVARVTDFAEHNGTPYLVMEYVPGETLAGRIESSGAMDPAEALQITLEVARAMDVAHQRGITHRDLKPQNIHIADGDVKVLDFGIARLEGQRAITSAGTLIGSPEYLSPERAEGFGDIRSDIYSLGVILYQMLKGKVPFDGGTPFTILRRHATEAPPPLPDGLPSSVYPIVEKCLAKRSEDRYQTPRELIIALQEALRAIEEERTTRRLAARDGIAGGRTLDLPAMPPIAPMPPSPSAHPVQTALPPVPPAGRPQPKRPPWPLLIGAAVLVAAVAIGGVLLMGRGGSGQKEIVAGTAPVGGGASVTAVPTAAGATPTGQSAAPALTLAFPAEGAEVTSPVRIEVTASGATLKSPAEGDPTARHLHYFIDTDPAAVLGPGQPVPTGNQNIIHTSATSQTIDLRPGKHTVWVVMTDNNHVPLTPPVQAQVSFTVTGTPARSGDQAPVVYQSLVNANGQNRWRLFVSEGQPRAVRPLPSANGDDIEPAWSPDGGKIAFVSDRGGGFHIYVVDANGANVQQLTRGSAQERNPAWSPDGSQIAFTSNRDGGRDQIFVMPAGGGDARQITRGNGNAGEPSWSADGKQIAFYREQGDVTHIFVVDVAGGEPKQLTKENQRYIDPAWSPDGRRIAFATFRDNTWNVFVMNADGSDVRQITNTGEVNRFPAWSPDGRQLVFASGRDGQQQIFVLNLDGGEPRRLTEGLAHSLHPSWPRK